MPLKQVSVKTSGAAPTKKNSEIPIYAPPEELRLGEYVQAVKNLREAQRVVGELEPPIKAAGVHQVLMSNTAHPDAPIATVRLVIQEGDEVREVRVSFTSKYSSPNAEAADELFKGLGADINDFIQQAVGAKFDADVFISRVGKDSGEFSKPIYDAYRKPLEKITAELISRGYLPEGTKCPLDTFPVVVVRKDFHARRWARFPKVGDQERIAEVVKNVVSATVE